MWVRILEERTGKGVEPPRRVDDLSSLAKLDDARERPKYERLLRQEILPGIAARGVHDYRGVTLLRRELSSGELEFMTIMRFDSLAAVREFAGEDYQRAVVPAAAREVLLRFDDSSTHYALLSEA